MNSKHSAWLGVAAAALLGASAHGAVLYADDFDGGFTIAPGATSIFGPYTVGTALAGPWNAAGWSGSFAQNTTFGNPASFTTLSISNIPTHSQISASFILGLLDSWDSYDGSPSPDNLEIWIDGVQVGNLTVNNASGSQNDTDGGAFVAQYQQVDTHQFYSDSLIDMTGVGYLTFAHSASTLNLGIRASGSGWQGGDDESWGIDKILLTYSGGTGGIPEPATWALMIAGFGAAGAMLRRRRGAFAL